jgi:hypothetical protein
MPMYDYSCSEGHDFEALRPMGTQETLCPVHVEDKNEEDGEPYIRECGKVAQRVWRATPTGGVIGDEIDVTIKHGLCHPDGTPRRFRSRAELRREEQRTGWSNHVEHIGTQGSDKSKHTTRWY